MIKLTKTYLESLLKEDNFLRDYDLVKIDNDGFDGLPSYIIYYPSGRVVSVSQFKSCITISINGYVGVITAYHWYLMHERLNKELR